MRDVRIDATFESWQQTARRLLSDAVAPDEVRWRATDSAVLPLFGATTADTGPTQPGSIPASQPEPSLTFTVPRRFLDIARHVAAGRDPARWALLYRVLWRVTRENRQLLELGSDPDVQELMAMEAEARSSPAGNAPPVGTAASIPAVVPPNADLSALKAAALTCTACDLYKTATQVVFGSGPPDAKVVFIGEQPGDQEDLKGQPFVGPAGEVFDRALAEVGIFRADVYVTNVVKHFKWEARGKRRIHQTPRASEIQACRPWLEAELARIKPAMVVCLGSTAAQALLGPQIRILKSRGQIFRTSIAPWVMATLHPSAVLRADDPAAGEATYRMLVEDLGKVAERLRVDRGPDAGVTI